jgi:hypothetical protein
MMLFGSRNPFHLGWSGVNSMADLILIYRLAQGPVRLFAKSWVCRTLSRSPAAHGAVRQLICPESRGGRIIEKPNA